MKHPKGGHSRDWMAVSYVFLKAVFADPPLLDGFFSVPNALLDESG